MLILEVGFGSSGVNIEKGYYPRGVTVVGLDPLLATYPPVTPLSSEYSTAATATTATTTTITAAERIYQQQAALAQGSHGVHLAGLVQGKAEELPFADASFDAVGSNYLPNLLPCVSCYPYIPTLLTFDAVGSYYLPDWLTPLCVLLPICINPTDLRSRS